MNSLIAILTYNRLEALSPCLRSIQEHCPNVDVAIFEDGGYMDDTVPFLTQSARCLGRDPELEAIQYVHSRYEAYTGTANLGVAGNSNRAIRYFMDREYDHLLLCNDDILAHGNFAKLYAQGHYDTDIHLFCRTDIDNDSTGHGWHRIQYRGHTLRVSHRLTGNMMSMTRSLINKIGYFDTNFGKFGNEHVAFTYRAGMSGMVNTDAESNTGVDIDHEMLSLQSVSSSMPGAIAAIHQAEGLAVMQEERSRYTRESWHRPFTLRHHRFVGAPQAGIPLRNLYRHVVVNDVLTPTVE